MVFTTMLVVGARLASGPIGQIADTHAAASPFARSSDSRSPAPLDPAERDPQLLPVNALSPSLLIGTSPTFMTLSVPTEGGAFVAGNVGFSFPASALVGLDNPISVSIAARPAEIPLPQAPWEVSADGTIFQLSVKDRNGNNVWAFPAAVTVLLRYSQTDLAIAGRNPNTLTAGFVVDRKTPAVANPMHLPLGTWVFFAPSVTARDNTTGTIVVRTQVAPAVLGIMTKPFAQVHVVTQQADLFSGFDRSAKLFGTLKQATVLQVAGPQIGDRLLVFNPRNNNYAYVNASEVGT